MPNWAFRCFGAATWTLLLADAYKNESKIIEETDESTQKFVLAGLGPNNDMEIEVTVVDPDKSRESSYITRRDAGPKKTH